MWLELSIAALAASLPLTSFLLKLTLDERYLQTREFDSFRAEARENFHYIRERLDRLT